MTNAPYRPINKLSDIVTSPDDPRLRPLMMPKKFATVAGKIGGVRVPVWNAEQMAAYRAQLGDAILKRLAVTEDELRDIGAMDDAMMAVPAGAVRELVYDLKQLARP